MPASYPNAVVTFATRNNGQTIDASHINALQDEVNAIEAGLLNGTAPVNSSHISGGAGLHITGNSTLGSSMTIGTLPYVFPSSGASTGQVLTCVTTSGSTMTLEWRTPSSPSIAAYTATVADVGNTASITTTISWTNTAAVADGDEIEIRCLVALKNDKGTSGTVTTTFGFGGATAASISGAATWADNATERIYILTYRFVRYGNDMYVAASGIASVLNVHNSFDDMNTTANTTKITTPTFTAGQTGLLRITLSAADAQFYWNTKSARIRHHS